MKSPVKGEDTIDIVALTIATFAWPFLGVFSRLWTSEFEDYILRGILLSMFALPAGIICVVQFYTQRKVALKIIIGVLLVIQILLVLG